jgi:PAS domain S-box-containing protein
LVRGGGITGRIYRGVIEMQSISWKILLVEDDRDDYILTRSLLADASGTEFELDWVSSYDQALEELGTPHWDAVLVDYMLGANSGLDLVREPVSKQSQIPFILLTGKGNYEVDIEAMEAGVTDYLVKGEVTAPLLERTIRYAIERHQSRIALQKAHDELEIRVSERTRDLAQANQELRKEIAERERVEKALRESEARFRRLAETTSSAIFIVQDEEIRYANNAAQAITGYSLEELTGMEFWKIVHPTYQSVLKQRGLKDAWSSQRLETAGDKIPLRYELKISRKDGKERWADLTLGKMEYEGWAALIVTAFDITERDLAEKALRKAKGELEKRVEERTLELQETNKKLQFELSERKRRSEEREKLLHQVETERERAESLLQENQEQREFLETLMQVAPVGVAVVRGPEHRYQFANPYYRAFLEKTPSTQLAGKSINEIFPETASKRILKLLQEVYASGENQRVDEVPMYSEKKGEHTYWNIDHVPLWDVSGEVNGVLIITHDVTDSVVAIQEVERALQQSKRAAEEAQHRADELNAVFAAMTDAVIIYGGDGVPLKANPTAINILGFDPAGMKRQELIRMLSLRFSDGRSVLPKNLPSSHALEGKTVIRERLLFTNQAGKTFTILASASPLITEGVVAVWHDVTEQEALLSQIEDEQSKLKAIFENAPEGIVVVDEASRIVMANPVAERIYARPIPFGQDYDSHLELHLCYPNGSPYDPRDLPLTRAALDGEVHTNQELLIEWPDGQKRDLLVNCAPIYDGSGRINGGVAIFQDITLRKQIQEKIRRNAAQIEMQHHLIQNREMERLYIAQEIHDGPLQDLIGSTFSLADALNMTDDESMVIKLNAILASLQAQIRELRAFSSELRPPTLAPYGLEKAIHSHVERFQEENPELNIHLDLMQDGKTLPDEIRLALYRIYQESLNNVVRHAEARDVWVEFKLDQDLVLLEIKDNGRGFELPDDWLELARRGHLGLVGIQERAEAIGGSLEILSHPGNGTLVKVSVPTVALSKNFQAKAGV